MRLGLSALLPFVLSGWTLAYDDRAGVPPDGSDLESFVTRPDLRPPRLHVNVFEPDLVSPGLWFVAPYPTLRDIDISTLYQPAQTGPHIYDAFGHLIWSGAHLLDPVRQAFDFRPVEINGSQQLSMLILPRKRSSFHPQGVGLLLDPSLQVHSEVHSTVGSGVEDMHEFNVIDNGRRALMLTFHEHAENVKLDGVESQVFLSVGNYGFVEIEVATGRVVFEWWSQDHIYLNETSSSVPNVGSTGTWDWLHLNSVDKNQHGDYLISGRFTDTVYKVSGADGSILWRLGGKFSSFQLEGFTFSAQHDARFRDADLGFDHDGAYSYISLMDNAAGGSVWTSNHSIAMVIQLDTAKMKASLVNSYPRPDGNLTIARGNFQILSNSNRLVGWSENAYCTEFTPDGRRVLETSFASPRMVTYRAYKAEFISTLTDNPIMKGFVFHASFNVRVTSFYASWNGATEVATWLFRATAAESQEEYELVGTAVKDGFETNLVISGSYKRAYVEAIAKDGTVLGRSVPEDLIPSASFTGSMRWLPDNKSDQKASETHMSEAKLAGGMFKNSLCVPAGDRLISAWGLIFLFAASSTALLAAYRRISIRRLRT